MGSISQTNYELTIQISIDMYYSYLKDDYQIRVSILQSQQLSCYEMCKIMSWMDQ